MHEILARTSPGTPRLRYRIPIVNGRPRIPLSSDHTWDPAQDLHLVQAYAESMRNFWLDVAQRVIQKTGDETITAEDCGIRYHQL